MAVLQRFSVVYNSLTSADFYSFRFKEVASKSKDDLVTLGFPEFTIEDFHETVRQFILDPTLCPCSYFQIWHTLCLVGYNVFNLYKDQSFCLSVLTSICDILVFLNL